jgi:hypothetical protein
MKLRSQVQFLFWLFPLIFGGGCVTKALWENGGLEACREPASPVHLHLFGETNNDLLVVYDEYSERSDKIKTRAYWLKKNQTRVNQQRVPHFASRRWQRHLPPVPVFDLIPAETNGTLTLYAVVQTNQQSFALYSGNREIGSHDLPVYNDGRGKFEKIALTPFAVTADLTIVGGYLGCIWIAEGGPGLSH